MKPPRAVTRLAQVMGIHETPPPSLFVATQPKGSYALIKLANRNR